MYWLNKTNKAACNVKNNFGADQGNNGTNNDPHASHRDDNSYRSIENRSPLDE